MKIDYTTLTVEKLEEYVEFVDWSLVPRKLITKDIQEKFSDLKELQARIILKELVDRIISGEPLGINYILDKQGLDIEATFKTNEIYDFEGQQELVDKCPKFIKVNSFEKTVWAMERKEPVGKVFRVLGAGIYNVGNGYSVGLNGFVKMVYLPGFGIPVEDCTEITKEEYLSCINEDYEIPFVLLDIDFM